MDPNQKKVVFRDAIWWLTHDEIDDFPRGRYDWFEERRRQEKARKENDVSELHELYLQLPPKSREP